MKKTTVLLAEDHTVVREGLRNLLEVAEDFEVVGEAADGRQAVELARELRPQLILMDIAMPGLNGFEATKQILRGNPAIKVLILSAHSDDEYVQHMISIGAVGYLMKQSSGQSLMRALRKAAQGQPCFSANIAKRLEDASHRRVINGEMGKALRLALTTREAEVLQLVAEGAANKQISSILGISIKTVEKHRQHLMDKLDIHETAGLTRHAIATGVIESSAQRTIS